MCADIQGGGDGGSREGSETTCLEEAASKAGPASAW